MASDKDLLVLKQKVDKLRSEADRAEGALQQTLARLKSEFKCETIQDAKKLLKKLKDVEHDRSTKFDATMEKFEEEWADVLKN